MGNKSSSSGGGGVLKVTLEDKKFSGGSGFVQVGKWKETPVAVKFLYPNTDDDEFDNEYQHMKEFTHPNLVKMYGLVEEPYRGIVMEFMPLGSLDGFLYPHQSAKKRALNPPVVQQKERKKPTMSWRCLHRVAVQVAEGMEYIHSKKCIHRDLKPGNILVAAKKDDGGLPMLDVKLADFGLTRKTNSFVMTTNIGTPLYMAPELYAWVSKGLYTNSVDVFAYGLLLREMLFEELPWTDCKFQSQIADRFIKGERPSLAMHGTLEPLNKIINMCWATDPAARPSFAQILSMLTSITPSMLNALPSREVVINHELPSNVQPQQHLQQPQQHQQPPLSSQPQSQLPMYQPQPQQLSSPSSGFLVARDELELELTNAVAILQELQMRDIAFQEQMTLLGFATALCRTDVAFTNSKLVRFEEVLTTTKEIRNLLTQLHNGSASLVDSQFRRKVQQLTNVITLQVYPLTALLLPDEHLFHVLHHLSSDPIASKFWETNFGAETFLVDWETFVDAFLNSFYAPINPDEVKPYLRYLLDNAQTGSLSIQKFGLFVKLFGMNITKVQELFGSPWFHGYISSGDSQQLLSQSPVGTYLFRFSKSSMTGFVACFVDPNEGVKQVPITVSNGRYRVQGVDETFSNLNEIINRFRQLLITPCTSPKLWNSSFFGLMEFDRAKQLLEVEIPGTYFIRLSTNSVAYVLCYVSSSGVVEQTKIIPHAGKFLYQENYYPSVQAIVDSLKENRYLTQCVRASPWEYQSASLSETIKHIKRQKSEGMLQQQPASNPNYSNNSNTNTNTFNNNSSNPYNYGPAATAHSIEASTSSVAPSSSPAYSYTSPTSSGSPQPRMQIGARRVGSASGGNVYSGMNTPPPMTTGGSTEHHRPTSAPGGNVYSGMNAASPLPGASSAPTVGANPYSGMAIPATAATMVGVAPGGNVYSGMNTPPPMTTGTPTVATTSGGNPYTGMSSPPAKPSNPYT
eukprot:TRINITY_DN7588_c0_g1_i3.p1 TRINITY_DN7588_c0_g1~~TRINITY_DN7588_c0_g1_i3.p1  ORF type:complete len:969 (+),score=243.30 TRINITY_DN7588_c0_g1_i3:146-3052(+)